MGVRRGAKQAFAPVRKKFTENMKSAAQFRLIGLILAMTVYFPVRHSHCTRARFTVLVSCSSELQFTYAPLRGRTWERILLLLVFIG